MEISNIVPLQKNQIAPAAEMLARAFDHDPFFRSLVPDDEKRLKKATHLFAFTLKLGYRYGEVYTTSQNLEGITVWMRPGDVVINVWRALRCGVIPLIFRVGPRLMKKMNAVDAYGERVRKRLAPDKYWYLAVLGVDPDHQGKGYASELMKPMLKRIDSEGLPCYLETDTEKNVSMYRHFGFKLLEHVEVPEYNTQFDAMMREPAAT